MVNLLLSDMPQAERNHIESAYSKARVILEYGSGNSTKIASQLSNKYILSVESDREWARILRSELYQNHPQSLANVYYVDIGRTGPWGRVLNENGWKNYHKYPNAIWDEPFFRQPDVILIDGRFRVACLITALLRIQNPVTVLFDDYTERPRYRLAEIFAQPTAIIGRLAQFDLVPNMIKPEDIGLAIAQYFTVSVHGSVESGYRITPKEEAILAERLSRFNEGNDHHGEQS